MSEGCPDCDAFRFVPTDLVFDVVEHEATCPSVKRLWDLCIDGEEVPQPGIILVKINPFTGNKTAHSVRDDRWPTCPQCLAQSLVDTVSIMPDGTPYMPVDHWPGCPRWIWLKKENNVPDGMRVGAKMKTSDSPLFGFWNPRF